MGPLWTWTDTPSAARLLPSSRLLSGNSWGHTAYGTSECETRAVGRYVGLGHLPDRGTRITTSPISVAAQRCPRSESGHIFGPMLVRPWGCVECGEEWVSLSR
ncbi:MAG: alpha/beta hydrolase [Terracoccus sp.]